MSIKGVSLVIGVAILAACGNGGDVAENASAQRSAQDVRPCLARAPEMMPERLSDLGCFVDADLERPASHLIPFAPNAPLWTDGAHKDRFVSLPAGASIELDDSGDFVLPVGSVLIKTFTLEGKRIETRLLVRHEDRWRGYPYRWNDAQDEAVLVPEGGEVERAFSDGRSWTIPSSNSCASCHNAETHVALGLSLAQLNGDLRYDGAEASENQLEHLEHLGVLPELGFPTEALPKLADYRDERAPLHDRARAYLHANCSSCHTAPENLCSGDLRWTADLQQMGVCDIEPKLPLPQAPQQIRLLAPGEPDNSAILLRLAMEPGTAGAMPPLGRAHLDSQGIALVREFIESLEGCEE